jgi:hypothetical protein
MRLDALFSVRPHDMPASKHANNQADWLIGFLIAFALRAASASR